MSLYNRIKKIEDSNKAKVTVYYGYSDNKDKPCLKVKNSTVETEITINQYFTDRVRELGLGNTVIDMYVHELLVMEQKGLFEFSIDQPRARAIKGSLEELGRYEYEH